MDVTDWQERRDTAVPRPDPRIFYEWGVDGDSYSGISLDVTRAKVALAQTLLQAGAGCGFVRPVALRHDGEDWAYQRFTIKCQAACADGVVTWHSS